MSYFVICLFVLDYLSVDTQIIGDFVDLCLCEESGGLDLCQENLKNIIKASQSISFYAESKLHMSSEPV